MIDNFASLAARWRARVLTAPDSQTQLRAHEAALDAIIASALTGVESGFDDAEDDSGPIADADRERLLAEQHRALLRWKRETLAAVADALDKLN